jgi:uncharacterized repeat protein (TIGR01451 family)
VQNATLFRVLFLLALTGLLTPLPSQADSDNPEKDSRDVCRPAAASQAAPGYALVPDGNRWKAECAKQKLRIAFTEDGARILPIAPDSLEWEWGISLSRFGGSEDLHSAGRAFLTVHQDRVEYLRGRLIEWFRNAPSGIEHGLDVPEGADSPILRFDFRVAGTLSVKVSEDGQSVGFAGPSGVSALAYRDLRVVDAEGREVASRWERVEPSEGSEVVLRLIVLSADHTFPLHLSARLATPKGTSRGGSGPPVMPETTLLFAPANDSCGAAEMIPAAGPFPFDSSVVDLTDATTTGDPPTPSCQADISRSVWFSFTPQSSASYTFSVCSDAPTSTTVEDTVLAVYASTGTCTGLVEISGGCSDDSCGSSGLQSAVSEVPLSAGSTYYIVAWSYGATPPLPGSESLQLHVVQHVPAGPPPPNDQCGGAEPIPGSGPFPYLTSVTSDISGATATGDPPTPSCQLNVSRSIWYSFTPVTSGRYGFSVCADGPTASTVDDTVLAVYSASSSCSGYFQVSGGCDDDSCTSEAAQSKSSGIDLTPGTTYYIVVWSYSSAPPTPGNTAIQLRVAHLTGPPNDSCSSAAVLTLDTPVSGTTILALDDTRLPTGSTCFGGIGQTPSVAPGLDVAYRFTAPEAGAYSFRLSDYDSSKNALLYVSSDCPSGASPALVAGCLAAANRTAISPEEVSCLPLAAGQGVYVFVDENLVSTGSAFQLEANRCTLESEPNGTPSLAGVSACGLEGSITPAGDADFFSLGIPEAGSRVFAILDGAAGNSTDFDLRVTTGADTLEYDDLNNDVPFGSVSPNISGAALNGALSFLRVSHYSSAAQAEPYRLFAWVNPPSAGATPEVEPNNSVATATGAANEYYTGSLSDAADVDVFSLPAAAGESIQIGLDLDPLRNNTPYNGSLALLDASGVTLVSVNDISSSASNTAGTGSLAASTPYAPAESLVYRARSTGMLYARVAWSSGIPGDYLLSIAHNCRVGPPTDVSVTQSDSPDPIAPGGTLTYSIVVHNLGTHPASVVTLSDELPAGSILVSALPSQGLCMTSQPVVCHLGNLAAGASASVSLVSVAPTTAGFITNTAQVAAAVIDSFPGNNSSSETSTVGLTDGDGDGVPDPSDCLPADPGVWAVPGEAMGLSFPNVSDLSLLQWSPPASPGGLLVSYDLLRSTTPGGFSSPGCVASGVTATTAHDSALPGTVFYYLVRSANACGGNLGTRSDGTPRTAGSCP